MSEQPKKLVEYRDLLEQGLSDHEARETVWPNEHIYTKADILAAVAAALERAVDNISCHYCEQNMLQENGVHVWRVGIENGLMRVPCLRAPIRALISAPAAQALAEHDAKLLAQENKFTYCAYCGHRESTDVDGEVIAQHIRVCEKHPMRQLEREQADRLEEVKQAAEEASRAEITQQVGRRFSECEPSTGKWTEPMRVMQEVVYESKTGALGRAIAKAVQDELKSAPHDSQCRIHTGSHNCDCWRGKRVAAAAGVAQK